MAVTKEVQKTLPARRKLRDKKRAEFFSDHGLKRIADPNEIELGADQAFSNFQKCLSIAKDIHEGEKSAINTLGQELSMLLLGFGIGTASKQGRPSLTSSDYDSLIQSFFKQK
ncbi:MAG: hypothetical protein ACRBCL_04065 [Maritimibacter sp.]